MISTIIIRYKLPSESVKFEEWKEQIDKASQQAVGYLDRTDLPQIAQDPFYSVILRFNNKDNAENWLHSDRRKSLLRKVETIAEERIEMLHQDDTFWFSTSPNKTSVKWKQVFVSFVAVYPLTQLIPVLVRFVFQELGISSIILYGIINGIIISACMVYFAMPLALKAFKRWY